MSNVMKELKSEISRLARKEARAVVSPVKKASTTYRGLIAGLRKQVNALQKELAGLKLPEGTQVDLAAGKQAALVNQIVRELFQNHRLDEKPLKELLGHTRFEVFMGMLLGIATSVNLVLHWLARQTPQPPPP